MFLKFIGKIKKKLINFSQNGEIKSCKFENGQLVKGHHGSYLVSTHDRQTMESWVASIRNNIACYVDV